jgi:hypothetical protein
MCGHLVTKYKECNYARAETTCPCDGVTEYLGGTCPRFHTLIVRIPGRCPRHLEEYYERGSDSDDYVEWGSDGMDVDEIW